MLTIFNRREVFLTMEPCRQAEIRGILAAHGIDYCVRTTNLLRRGAGGRGGMVNVIADQSHAYEYRIYVHRKDYEKAARLIR